MNVSKDDLGIDYEKAKKCAIDYSKSTGMDCIIIDSTGRSIFGTQRNSGNCEFCKSMAKVMGTSQDCSKVHLYGSYEAERFGGKYVFFCPMGMVHWAASISDETGLRGALLGGPVLMVNPEDFLLEELLPVTNIPLDKREEITKAAKLIPVVRPDVVNSLSEVLFIVTGYINDSKYNDNLEAQEQQGLQAEISQSLSYLKSMGGGSDTIDSYPLSKEKDLLNMIAIGDKAGSQKILNDILAHIYLSTGRNFDLMKTRVLELVVLLSRASLEGGADSTQIFGLNYRYLSEIHNFTKIEDLTYWLSNIMKRFTDCVFNLKDVKHVDVIYKASDYIKRNYMTKLTLEDVAAHVYLSPSYFSKVFKDEMKCNFNAYLNKVRIDMSKKLLLNDNIALVDISNMVGYEDQSYFTRVFKKMTGASPGRFRESRGVIKSSVRN